MGAPAVVPLPLFFLCVFVCAPVACLMFLPVRVCAHCEWGKPPPSCMGLRHSPRPCPVCLLHGVKLRRVPCCRCCVCCNCSEPPMGSLCLCLCLCVSWRGMRFAFLCRTSSTVHGPCVSCLCFCVHGGCPPGCGREQGLGASALLSSASHTSTNWCTEVLVCMFFFFHLRLFKVPACVVCQPQAPCVWPGHLASSACHRTALSRICFPFVCIAGGGACPLGLACAHPCVYPPLSPCLFFLPRPWCVCVCAVQCLESTLCTLMRVPACRGWPLSLHVSGCAFGEYGSACSCAAGGSGLRFSV